MTDPEFADATYIEPITPEYVEQVIARERPDALLPTLGGQTALNTAVALHEAGVLEKYGVELIGANIDAIRRGEDRQLFKDIVAAGAAGARRRGPRGLPLDGRGPRRPSPTSACRWSSGRRSPWAASAPAWRTTTPTWSGWPAAGSPRRPVHEVLIEESVLGWKEYELELMRDRHDNVVVVCSIENIDAMGVHTGDSVTVAPAMTLTDREYQAHARPRHRRAARGRGRHRRLQHPVRGPPGDRPARRHRDEPAGVALVGAGVEGHRLPDREDRREARHRLHARRDRQRHHPQDAGRVRAGARLRRGEGAAVRVREVPGRRRRADHHDEVGRRGDGAGPQLHRGAGQGAAVDGDSPRPASGPRPTRPASTVDNTLPRCGCRTTAGSTRSSARCASARRSARSPRRPASTRGSSTRSPAWSSCGPRSLDAAGARRARCCAGPSGPACPTGSSPRCGRSSPARTACARCGTGWAYGRSTRPWTPARPSSPRTRRTTTRPTTRRPRSSRRTGPKVLILGSGPNRIGQGIEFDYSCVHAVHGAAGRWRADRTGRLRDRDGQLQPGDGLDRLRHRRPALLRAADVRGRARGLARRAHLRPGRRRPGRGRRDRAARRADAARAWRSGSRTPACRSSAPRRSRSTWPRTAARSARCWARPAWSRRRTAPRPASRRRRRSPTRSATRCWSGRPTCSAAAAWRSCTTTTRCAATSTGPPRSRRRTRCWSTGSWTTPSRSTWTRSATRPATSTSAA